MYKMVFYGGPKDGFTNHQSAKPIDVMFFADGCDTETICDVITLEEFRDHIQTYPSRTLKYAKYSVSKINGEVIDYSYLGLI